MAQINVLVVMDAPTILQTYGTNSDANNPRSVSDNTIFMVTDQANALSGNGGAALTIKAEPMDEILWQATSISLDTNYFVILYRFVAGAGGDLISTPQPNLAQVKVPLPNLSDPFHPGTQTIEAYYWSSNVQSPGSVTYHFNFMILDRHGNVKGYYSWDPYIKIVDD